MTDDPDPDTEAGNDAGTASDDGRSHGGQPDEVRSAAPLEFPRVARLALDELLDELVDRAGEVKATQGRLRGLLAATHHVAGGLDLEELLQRVVESARSLTGARYAALGLVREGRLDKFVHTGMEPDQVSAMGDLPVGKGVLGHLIDQPAPLRLDDLATHPAASGFPGRHPPMTSFLGVPIKVGDTVYGNLYLTQADRGSFSVDDEELVVALGAAAGLAIENALLFEQTRRRERWQAVSTRITRDLLARDLAGRESRGTPEPGDELPAGPWQRLLELAMDAAEAHGAAICAVDPHRPDTVVVPAAVGTVSDWKDERVARAGSITDAALGADGPISIDDTTSDPRAVAATVRIPGTRRAIATRLSSADSAAPMVIVLTRQEGAAPFGAPESDMVAGFADHVATALALEATRDERAARRRAASSERLAHHLNDQVMGQLMRLSLDLAGLATQVPTDLRGLVLDQIDSIDRITRAIRDTVFSLDIP